ncbi:hypothetical protein MKK84_00245 [Methylobacterium sp. E-065]|uniref:hypothetical protein n=1 Tax=Methylobacterium sp. E-065 TaxID=2836583 RepID=UPI001FBAC00B|nr:hypothetical protein [Methylobacterium sp. E-065]MCJ2015870.1 hypothetical protein [Methylobacterium sp. E-065]
MPFELAWNIEPDERGVIDGRELARELIAAAYRALVPYVDACPACADNLFGVIANKAIDDVQRDGYAGAGLYVVPHPAQLSQADAEAAHLQSSRETTHAMLEGIDYHWH